MFNSNFLRKMTKRSFNLRNGVKIACLVGITMFFGCDKTTTGGSSNNNTNGNNGNGGGKIDHPIVGVWSKEYLPSSFAMTLYNTYTTGLHEVTEMISKESSISGAVFVSVYREDGTAYEMYLNSDTYGWLTFNYSIKGNTMYRSKILGTHNSKKYPSTNYENKSYPNSEKLFKVQVNSGKEQLVVKPDFLAGSEYDKMTIDEYIEKGDPIWYTRLKEE